ncbi:MAG: hypothetical protein Q7J28_11785 [Caulobacter sp.]|nr:hypothetical protein [Caulobacter sp.]
MGDEDSFNVEPFSQWWERNGHRFVGVDPLVLEQWVHRHFHLTPFKLPLNGLVSRREAWTTDDILKRVHTSDRLSAGHDYQALGANWGQDMLALGTWRCPILVLETPNGLRQRAGDWPLARYALIEGHRRFRMLNALACRNEAAFEHDVLLIAYEDGR